MTKVCKSNGEGTFAGTRGNGEVAPIPDLPALASERGGPTQSRPYHPGGVAFLAPAISFRINVSRH
jgi:hypothetical protein